MYDELIKRMRELASIPEHCEDVESCDQCPKEDICLSFTNKRIIEVVTQAADAIEELQRQIDAWVEPERKAMLKSIPRWIPVTERLPEKDGKYLTVHTLNSIPPQPWIEVCWFAKDLYKVDKYDFHDKKKKSGFYQYDSEWGNFERTGISHWMPLPSTEGLNET